jgi:DNA-binding CsgD family transcriptional regulator
VPRSVVGRTGDLSRIRTVLDAAVAEVPGTVLVLGEAGVGKTTLLQAALRVAADEGFAVAAGACGEGATHASFAPVRAAMRTLVGQYDDEVVAAAVAGSPVAAFLLPASVRPASVPDASPDAGEQHDAVLEFLGVLAAERALVFALEDLHWADRSTLELLSFLARNLGGERVVVIGTVRTDEALADDHTDRTLTELGRLGNTTRLDLRGLDVVELAELVAGAGVDLDGREVGALHVRTAGNPFFALELVTAGSAGSGPVPPSVTDVVAIRLRTLTDDEQSIVRAAAVAGDADVEILAVAIGRPVPEIEAAYRAGAAAGLMAASPETGAMTFRHAIVRESTYAGLLASERRRLHEAIADALAAAPGTDPALLAHHYAAAECPADVLRTSVAAARAAAGARGSVDAVDHYMRAVRTWDDVPVEQRPEGLALDDLLQEAMECALQVGTVDEGAELGTRVLERLDPAGDPERWALLAARQSELRWELGDDAGASALLDRAHDVLEGRSDSVARVRLLERRAFRSVVTGHGAEGAQEAREALETALRVGDPEAVAVALNRVALAATALGEADGYLRLQEAFETAAAARLPAEAMRAGVNRVLLLHAGCRLDDAIAAGERGRAVADELGVGPTYRAVIGALHARALIDRGDWEEAGDLLAGLRLPNAQRFRTYVSLAIAELAAGRGDVELAHRMLTEGRFDLILVLALRRGCLEAELALAAGEHHLARATVDQYLPFAMFILDGTHARLTALGLSALGPDDTAAADSYLAAAEARAAQVASRAAGAPADQPAWMAVAAAFHAGHHGRPTTACWTEATRGFGRAGLRVRRAWSQFRAATAVVEEGGDRGVAAGLAAEAHAFASSIGAAPLRTSVETLVRRARLDVPGVERIATGDLGLTAREAEVLRLVAEGRTNREIADELFISAKTASVHVSNILRKVGATTRGEAAAIAHREGLTTG